MYLIVYKQEVRTAKFWKTLSDPNSGLLVVSKISCVKVSIDNLCFNPAVCKVEYSKMVSLLTEAYR